MKISEIRSSQWSIGFLLLIALFILIGFSSCSHSKDLTKTDTTVKTESEVKTVTTRTITETAQDTLSVKGSTLTKEADIEEVVEHPIEIENEDLKLTVTVDKVTKKIKATAIKKQKDIPININKTTIEKVDSKEKTKSSARAKTKDVHKEVTGGFNLNWLWLILVLILIFLAWRYGLFNKKPTG